jgi:hypothetical protein
MTPAEEYFSRCYDVLCRHAGARDSTLERMSFVMHTSGTRVHPTSEWRFGGTLGFGGKFWPNDGDPYVTCYPEDMTEKRAETVAAVNKLLKEIPRP